MKILYLHGFKSSGDGEKSKLLKEAFPECEIISPDLSADPIEVLIQIEAILKENSYQVILVGTSLGGFYASYFGIAYDLDSFIINQSLTPHISLRNKVGEYKRYNSQEDYNFKKKYLNDLEKLFKYIMEDSFGHIQRLNFYLSTDDEEVEFGLLEDIFTGVTPQQIKCFCNSGHRFSRFTEIFPDIKKIIK